MIDNSLEFRTFDSSSVASYVLILPRERVLTYLAILQLDPVSLFIIMCSIPYSTAKIGGFMFGSL